MKKRFIVRIAAALCLPILVIVPGCCWSNPLQKCYSCEDESTLKKPLKPRRARRIKPCANDEFSF